MGGVWPGNGSVPRNINLDNSRERAYSVLMAGMDRGCFDIFSHVNHTPFLSPSLWDTDRLTGAIKPNFNRYDVGLGKVRMYGTFMCVTCTFSPEC